jgi:hypothetical protein
VLDNGQVWLPPADLSILVVRTLGVTGLDMGSMAQCKEIYHTSSSNADRDLIVPTGRANVIKYNTF